MWRSGGNFIYLSSASSRDINVQPVASAYFSGVALRLRGRSHCKIFEWNLMIVTVSCNWYVSSMSYPEQVIFQGNTQSEFRRMKNARFQGLPPEVTEMTAAVASGTRACIERGRAWKALIKFGVCWLSHSYWWRWERYLCSGPTDRSSKPPRSGSITT